MMMLGIIQESQQLNIILKSLKDYLFISGSISHENKKRVNESFKSTC